MQKLFVGLVIALLTVSSDQTSAQSPDKNSAKTFLSLQTELVLSESEPVKNAHRTIESADVFERNLGNNPGVSEQLSDVLTKQYGMPTKTRPGVKIWELSSTSERTGRIELVKQTDGSSIVRLDQRLRSTKNNPRFHAPKAITLTRSGKASMSSISSTKPPAQSDQE